MKNSKRIDKVKNSSGHNLQSFAKNVEINKENNRKVFFYEPHKQEMRPSLQKIKLENHENLE